MTSPSNLRPGGRIATASANAASAEERRLALVKRLNALHSPGPASFQQMYWRNVLQRTSGQRPAVTRVLLDKAEVAIKVMESRAPDAREDDAASSETRTAESHRLRAGTQQYLATLNSACSQEEPLLSDNSPAALLPGALAEQDRHFWAAMGLSDANRPPSESAEPAPMQGLQAARDLVATRARFQLDQLLATALTHQPEFPGPLNPQRLLVRLLTGLHDASPAYLMRTLDHSRTLFELQGSKAIDTSKSNRKKAARPPTFVISARSH